MISILHPSRQRQQKSSQTTARWLQRSGIEDYELIVSIDSDDPQRQEYYSYYTGLGNDRIKLTINDNRSAVDAINNAAKAAMGDIFIVLSDDTDCPPNWGNIIDAMVLNRRDFVLKVYDGIQSWIVTMPIMDREYYNRFGYIYHPDYFHCFCDTEFTHVADITKRLIVRNDINFPHLHYSVAKAKKDEINDRADASWNQGKALYLARFRKDFGLTNVNRWDIQSPQHYQWLKNAL